MRKVTNEHYALEFRKGGILVYNDWVYDHEKGEGHYDEIDVTALQWIHKRDRPVHFANDVTLNDVFLFAAREPEMCDAIFCNCYVLDFLKAWAKIDPANIKPVGEYDPDGVEYLELYWGAELFTYEGVTDIDGLSRADFHGIGYVLKEDKVEGEGEHAYTMWKQGDRIRWGIDFMSLTDLLALPIKLNEEFVIMEEWDKGKDMKTLAKLVDAKRKFTFHEAIEGILWELSFYGAEEDKMVIKDDVLGIKAEIDAAIANGTLDQITTPLDLTKLE
jgi:hypothetical protein